MPVALQASVGSDFILRGRKLYTSHSLRMNINFITDREWENCLESDTLRQNSKVVLHLFIKDNFFSEHLNMVGGHNYT